MRFQLYSLVVFFLVSTCAGQTFFPKKDLTFGQVVVGDVILVESELSVTNRGIFTYTGTLFFRKGEGEIWNPVVDGLVVVGGKRSIELAPGETQTFRITGTGLQQGTIMLVSEDLVLDNFVEGNLTYFYKAGNGDITDSIGIAPSQEFYFATVPFNNFSSFGLALANGNVDLENSDLVGRSNANVTLLLYDADGVLVATSNDELLSPMVPMAHIAQFLRDYFAPGIQLTQGRVEIISDVPIFGTALTFLSAAGGSFQASSLPLEPSPVAYTIEMTSDLNDILIGDVALWAEGYFVKGYMVISMVNGMEVDPVLTLVNGQLIDGILELSFYAQGTAFEVLDDEVSLALEVLGGFSFLPSADTFNGPWVMTSLIDPGATLAGTFVLNRMD